MKKINGGSGRDIEVSDDIADIVDPESMLSDSIPEVNNKVKITSDVLPEEQTIIITHFVTSEEEYKITGLLKRVSISNNNIEYEFFMLKKHLSYLLRIQKLEIHKIYFLLGDEENEFCSDVRPVKKIEFESFGKQIKCHVFT